MYKEERFFRFGSKEGNGGEFKEYFRKTIRNILYIDRKQSGTMEKTDQLILSDLCATCIAYAYLDWLSGAYGNAELENVISVTKNLLENQIDFVSYRKFMVQ